MIVVTLAAELAPELNRLKVFGAILLLVLIAAAVLGKKS